MVMTNQSGMFGPMKTSREQEIISTTAAAAKAFQKLLVDFATQAPAIQGRIIETMVLGI